MTSAQGDGHESERDSAPQSQGLNFTRIVRRGDLSISNAQALLPFVAMSHARLRYRLIFYATTMISQGLAIYLGFLWPNDFNSWKVTIGAISVFTLLIQFINFNLMAWVLTNEDDARQLADEGIRAKIEKKETLDFLEFWYAVNLNIKRAEKVIYRISVSLLLILPVIVLRISYIYELIAPTTFCYSFLLLFLLLPVLEGTIGYLLYRLKFPRVYEGIETMLASSWSFKPEEPFVGQKPNVYVHVAAPLPYGEVASSQQAERAVQESVKSPSSQQTEKPVQEPVESTKTLSMPGIGIAMLFYPAVFVASIIASLVANIVLENISPFLCGVVWPGSCTCCMFIISAIVFLLGGHWFFSEKIAPRYLVEEAQIKK